MNKIFISTTYVDAQTNIPYNEAPCRNGHKLPDGITPIFDIEEARWSEKPTVYGWAEEGFEPLPYMQELEEDSVWETFKHELRSRVNRKRKEVEFGGISIPMGDDAVFIETDADSVFKLNAVVSNISLAEIDSVNFKAASGFVELTSSQLKEIAKAVVLHVQECFTWEKEQNEAIDALELSLETVGDVLPILKSINTFGLVTPEEEEPEQGE